jgi:hypothetical protein
MALIAKVGQSPFDTMDARARGHFRQADKNGLRQTAAVSTSTGRASIPTRANERSLASFVPAA